MKDIEDIEDIEILINRFYDQARQSPVIGPIFNEVAKVDWDLHLPKMYAFWNSMLFGDRSYSGNPMQKHIELSRLTRLTDVEFSEWVSIFKSTMDELYDGPKADEAKQRADNIARLMLHKIQSV